MVPVILKVLASRFRENSIQTVIVCSHLAIYGNMLFVFGFAFFTIFEILSRIIFGDDHGHHTFPVDSHKKPMDCHKKSGASVVGR